MIGKVRVEHKCKIISKFDLVGMRWDEKVKVEQKTQFFSFFRSVSGWDE